MHIWTKNSTVEQLAAVVLYRVNGCKGGMERAAYCYGTLRRPDCQPLMVGLDWAIEQGLIEWKSAKGFHGRFSHEAALYLTKAGKAWLHAYNWPLPSEEIAKAKAALWANEFGGVA